MDMEYHKKNRKILQQKLTLYETQKRIQETK